MPGSIRSYVFAKHLIKRGHEVFVITTSRDIYQKNRKNMTNESKINVIWIRVSYSNRMKFIRRLWAFSQFALFSTYYALRLKPDLVFATSTPLTVAIPAVIAKKRYKCPMVFEVRDLWPEMIISMGAVKNPIIIHLMYLMETISYKNANHLIALAPGIKKGIMNYGISTEKISFIPNGCDLNMFNTKIVQDEGKENFIIAYTGAHGMANSLDIVLNSAIELKKTGHTNINIVLVGEGSEKKRLQNLVINNDLDNVTFIEPMSKKELAIFLNKVDVGLQILAPVKGFQESTSPNKFFDYCSAGLPILITYQGWISRLVSENNMGWIVDDNNPKSLAQCMVAASKLRINELRVMGQNAKKLAETKFNRSLFADQFVNILENEIA